MLVFCDNNIQAKHISIFMRADTLFNLPPSLGQFADFFRPDIAPWEWVRNIKAALASIDFSKFESKKNIPAGVHIEGDVFIHPSVDLPPFACIKGPAWIGEGVEMRVGCFVRGNVITGKGCVMGNSCEYKNSLLLDKVQTPHYNYVGDSVLGNSSHLGAGVICANLRLDKNNVLVYTPEGRLDSGLRKLGALLGDEAEAGCNSVLQPGSMLMKRSIIFSCMAYSGIASENTMYGGKHTLRTFPRIGF